MDREQLEALEFESALSEKRDKLNGRIQLLTLYLSMATLFGAVSIQPGVAGYLVGLFPWLAAFLASFVAHSEIILDQAKKFIYEKEAAVNYAGYEHHNQQKGRNKRRRSGVQNKAMRNIFLMGQVTAAFGVAGHLFFDLEPWLPTLLTITLTVVLFIVEIFSCWKTWQWMNL